MKSFYRKMIIFLLCFGVLLGAGASSSFALREEFVDTSSFLVKVCVYIEFYFEDGTYGGFATSRGTGLLVGSDGVMQGVVTNASVCSGDHLEAYAEEICNEYGFEGYTIGVPQVILEGNDSTQGISGRILLCDEERDVAVLQLASPVYIADTLKIRSLDSLEIGEQVYSIGYAEVYEDVYELSVYDGFVSDIQYVEADRFYGTFVEHDVPISQTAQGGFLLDCDGSIIGMITDKASASPYNKTCAVSMYDIFTFDIYYFGWDDFAETEMPIDAVIGYPESDITQDFYDDLEEQGESCGFFRVLLIILAILFVVIMFITYLVVLIVCILVTLKINKKNAAVIFASKPVEQTDNIK